MRIMPSPDVARQADGAMTAMLVDRDSVFVLFGSCTPL